MPYKLTGSRLTRFQRIIATNPPTGKELTTLKSSFQKLEAKARRTNERRQNVRDLKRGADQLAQQENDAFKEQEQRFLDTIAKEERRILRAEKEEKKAAKRFARKERKATLFAHYEVRKPKKDGTYEVIHADVAEAHSEFSFTTKRQLKKLLAEKEREIRQNHEQDDYYSSNVKILLRFSHQISAVHKEHTNIEKIPMKGAFTLRRDWLRYSEGIAENSFQDLKGQCVYELLIGLLGSYWKTINKQQLFEYFQTAVRNKGGDYLKGEPFHGEFTMDSGVNTDMLKYLCEKRQISLYGYNAQDHCFVKQTSVRKSNYRPICFYHIDGHMYLITGADEVKSIGSHREEKTTVVSSLLEMDAKDKAVDREYVDADGFQDALQYENKLVYLKQRHMTAEVIGYIRETHIQPKVKARNHLITEVFLKEKNLTIICDSNEDDYTWKDIKSICDKAGVPFKNQQIGGLIRTLGKKFFKTERRVLTDEEKLEIVAEQKQICVLCDRRTTKWEYDHAVPLNAGGTNDMENFQALCVPCHLQKTKEENEAGDFIKYDPVASTFNASALEIIQSNHFKQWAFVERLKAEMGSGVKENQRFSINEIHKLDHAKCRRNLVMHGKYPFPKFSVMDSPTEYDGSDIQCGLYFVETDNYFPFRGNGWYSYAMVKDAIALNIIGTHQLTHQFLSSFQLPADYFKAFAEYLIDMSFDPREPVTEEEKKKVKMDKLIVNSMVGCWATNRSTFESLRFDADKHRASTALIQEGTFVESFDMDGTPLFAIHEKKEIQKDDMFLPLYHQIMSMEAMGLYKLEQLIKAQGGVPLERNTDAILYRGPAIDISHMTHSDGATLKYRYDDVTPLKVEEVCRFTRNGTYRLPCLEYRDFTEQDDFQAVAQQIYDSNLGCFVSGYAGVGKTVFSNTLIQLIETNGKKCVKLAPTRKAASHIGGKTIHKFYMNLALSNNYEKKILQSLQHTDYIFVDEISMVKEVFYRFFTMLKRYAPQLKFIIVGDYDQLPPVNDEYKGDYESSAALYHLCDGQRLRLEKCRRSDDGVFDLYNGVRLGTAEVDVSQFKPTATNRLNIAYSHETRKRVNAVCMTRFREGRPFLSCGANERNPKTQAVQIYVGMPIVSYKNDARKGLENSALYTVRSIDEEAGTFSIEVGEPDVRSGSGNKKKTEVVSDGESHTLTLNANEFKNLFYPGFCITVHVSQGCSFDEPYTIHDWNMKHMDHRAKYVALSRARKMEYIHIVG
jgi:5-methylcytosine-specific restriction endonuclease McrA